LIIHHVTSVERDQHLDLALIETKTAEGEVKPIRIGRAFPPVGLDVLAVGCPLPEQPPVQINEVEKRADVEVTAIFRAIKGIVASRLVDGLHFEIDKLANPGQSGGPVVAIGKGEVVGMCQASKCYSLEGGRVFADLSMCLSIDAIRSRLNQWDVEV
jgi:S1-C subfamily serine protease